MRKMIGSAVTSLVFSLAFVTASPSAWADFVTFTGTGAGGRSASVTFETSGGNLIVTLTNTSTMDVTQSSEVLTAVFFSAPGTLTRVSAEVTSGSVVNYETAAGTTAFPDVGGEWSYEGNIDQYGANSGISSAGFDLFGSGNRFPGADLDPPASPNGINYGITSAGDDPTTGNGGLLGNGGSNPPEPLIQNSVTFTLSGWDASWSLSDIGNITFQYGTSLSEPNVPGVPEPGMLALLGVGLVGLVFAARKFSWA